MNTSSSDSQVPLSLTAKHHAQISITAILCICYLVCAGFVFVKRKTIYRDVVPFATILNCFVYGVQTAYLGYSNYTIELVCFWFLWLYFICGGITGAVYTVKCVRVIIQFYCEFIESGGMMGKSPNNSSNNSSNSETNPNSDTPIISSPLGIKPYDTQQSEMRPSTSFSFSSADQRKETIIDLVEYNNHKNFKDLDRARNDMRQMKDFLEEHKVAWFIYQHRHWNTNRNLVKIFSLSTTTSPCMMKYSSKNITQAL